MSGGNTRDDESEVAERMRRLSGSSKETEAGDPLVNGAQQREPVAIIGMACRLPGAPGPAEFWTLLRDGKDAISEVPKERWDLERFYDPDGRKPGRSTTRWGGFIAQIDSLDHKFFRINPIEARSIDPQQRLLLELAWEALEDAGQSPKGLGGTRTGVFIGISSFEYSKRTTHAPESLNGYTGTGAALSIAANRISYYFDFHGPSMAIDTACSSALVAAHLALSSLSSGECSLALVGGVNLLLGPEGFIVFSQAGMMAPDGRCKTFDSRANGYVRGEGGGIVVLKPLRRALADGDRVYAIIRGSAINQDGRTNGLTAPSSRAQEEVLRDAYGRAGVKSRDVRYVEAHGTGTNLGDPIEAKALGTVMGDGRPQETPCLVGSVKTNIGHLEAASGIASVIKVALALYHRQIPPSLHFQQPNPKIDFEQLKLRVVTDLTPLTDSSEGTLAGVSSFGFGGTNAHLVLQGAAREQGQETELGSGPGLLLLSARRPEALVELARSYEQPLNEATARGLGDICYTAAARREHHEYRLAVAASTPAGMVARLRDWIARGSAQPIEGTAWGKAGPSSNRKVAFVFSDTDSEVLNAGRRLVEAEPICASAVRQCDAVFRRHAGCSALDLLSEKRDSSLEAAALAFGGFSIQLALAALWRSWGVEPSAVVGSGFGEIAAACVSGILDLENSTRIISNCVDVMRPPAGNGQAPGLDMGAISPEFSLDLRTMPSMRPTIPCYSARSGTRCDDSDRDGEYWARSVMEPASPSTAFEALIADGCTSMLAMGSASKLLPAINEAARALGRDDIVALACLRSGSRLREALSEGLGALYALGIDVSWQKVFLVSGRVTTLPAYPWQRERFWIETSEPPSTGD